MADLEQRGTRSPSTRETADKVRNLRDDPRLVLCVFTDQLFGPWLQIEGTASRMAVTPRPGP